jgi:hypothetical protein
VSNPRPWVIGKLRDSRISDGLRLETVGSHGLRVIRDAEPDALIHCAGVDGDSEAFGLDDLDHALRTLSGTQFVVVVPTRIDHAVYARAEELGLCVDGFGELVSALADGGDLAQHVGREQAYVMRRMRHHRRVLSVRRRGANAYELERSSLPALTVLTTGEYEPTADDVYSLLESYAGMAIDAIAITNPNVRGISSDAIEAGERAGVHVLLFSDFLGALDERWT